MIEEGPLATEAMDLPRWIHARINRWPGARSWWVALSGGTDSTALLHALSCLADSLETPPLHAIHVNHGLNKEADQWQEQVVRFCQSLNIPLVVERATVTRIGDGLEAAARKARYAAFAQRLPARSLLLTAHHQDDQAETLLLRLMRGSGLRGLAGIPPYRHLAAEVFVGRPLLELSRQQLRIYCQAHQLAVIEDPANTALEHDRNFLRHRIFPLLKERWPAAAASAAVAASWLRQAEDQLSDYETQWLSQHVDQSQSLDLNALAQAPERYHFRLIRSWLISMNVSLPTARQLQELVRQIWTSAADRRPCLQWPAGEMRQYHQRLYYLRPRRIKQGCEERIEQCWHSSEVFSLPGLGQLRIASESVVPERQFVVTQRRGGERIAWADRSHRSIKKLMQEQHVPPWLRNVMPFIYYGAELWAVGDRWMSPACRDWLRGFGGEIVWRPPTNV